MHQRRHGLFRAGSIKGAICLRTTITPPPHAHVYTYNMAYTHVRKHVVSWKRKGYTLWPYKESCWSHTHVTLSHVGEVFHHSNHVDEAGDWIHKFRVSCRYKHPERCTVRPEGDISIHIDGQWSAITLLPVYVYVIPPFFLACTFDILIFTYPFTEVVFGALLHMFLQKCFSTLLGTSSRS